MNLCLAVEHCWVFYIGSCEPVHEYRTLIGPPFKCHATRKHGNSNVREEEPCRAKTLQNAKLLGDLASDESKTLER